jgi:glutathione S-transferase
VARLVQLEAALGDGPFFAGARFGLVDAAFGPVFRYLDAFEGIADFGWLDGLAKLPAWRRALAARPSVRAAMREDYPQRLRAFIAGRGSALSRRLAAVADSAVTTVAA